jgi:hypothetical protein
VVAHVKDWVGELIAAVAAFSVGVISVIIPHHYAQRDKLKQRVEELEAALTDYREKYDAKTRELSACKRKLRALIGTVRSDFNEEEEDEC